MGHSLQFQQCVRNGRNGGNGGTCRIHSCLLLAPWLLRPRQAKLRHLPRLALQLPLWRHLRKGRSRFQNRLWTKGSGESSPLVRMGLTWLGKISLSSTIVETAKNFWFSLKSVTTIRTVLGVGVGSWNRVEWYSWWTLDSWEFLVTFGNDDWDNATLQDLVLWNRFDP